MISIICVYNNLETLNNCLLKSLDEQSKAFDLCLVDNTHSKFSSAAAALNYGARKAKGEWLLFAHQDVIFLSPKWLEETENVLNNYNPQGWTGSAGINSKGICRAFIRDSEMLLGTPFQGLSEVQTLDECLLICANENKDKYFDEALDGWHQYGVDVCCQALLEGKKNYVLPFPIWHNSKRVNVSGLKQSQDYIWRKYKDEFDRIFTTCGILSDRNDRSLSERVKFRLASSKYKLFSYQGDFSNSFSSQLEFLTKEFRNILCLHSNSPQSSIETNSFTQFTDNKRNIIHSFSGLKVAEDINYDCIVIERDLAPEAVKNLLWFEKTIDQNKKILLCISVKDTFKVKPLLGKVSKLAKVKIHIY